MAKETPIESWSSAFGDMYTDRNQVDWRDREQFWYDIMVQTGARSVFEMGANCGWNLSAIRRQYPDVTVMGNDVNQRAVIQARMAGLEVEHKFDIDVMSKFELVFTAGVLIHVPPDDLKATMQAIIDKSYRYVLAVEYNAYKETEVEYRGESGMLWKRPYGMLYENLGLKPIAFHESAEGFDSCAYWLFEK